MRFPTPEEESAEWEEKEKLLLSRLLDLAVEDPEAVRSFCEDRIPGWWIGGPIDPFDRLEEAKTRLRTAQSLARFITDALYWGDEEQWTRLEAAAKELAAPKPQGVMKLRTSVLAAVAYAKPLPPCGQCRKCLAWVAKSPCYCGADVEIEPPEMERALSVLTWLEGISKAFCGITPEEVARVLAKSTPTMQAAKLSRAVRAFGDEGSEETLQNTYHAAWMNVRGQLPPGSDPSKSAKARKGAQAKNEAKLKKAPVLKPL